MMNLMFMMNLNLNLNVFFVKWRECITYVICLWIVTQWIANSLSAVPIQIPVLLPVGVTKFTLLNWKEVLRNPVIWIGWICSKNGH